MPYNVSWLGLLKSKSLKGLDANFLFNIGVLFSQFLVYKCERNGGQLVNVKPRFTTQDCSDRGKRVKKSLFVRTQACPDCGLVLGRNHNAALNIEKAGLAQIGAIPAI